jgi:G:T-mismatch repair DNA endonuclease (very short patch repair protein)
VQLENLGWRILVVWECELTRKSIETINRVANWLSGDNVCYNGRMKQNELLTLAEKKIRYRISAYVDEPGLNETE